MSTTRGVKHGAPAAHECGRRVMTGYRNWDRGSRRCAGSVTTTSESPSRLRVFNLDITRDHNHDGLRLALLVFEQGVESGSVRQIDVLRHRRGPFRVEGLQRRGHRRGFERVLSPSAQRFGQRVANRRVVINHEHFLFWHSHASFKNVSAILLRIDVIRQTSVVADSRLPLYSETEPDGVRD